MKNQNLPFKLSPNFGFVLVKYFYKVLVVLRDFLYSQSNILACFSLVDYLNRPSRFEMVYELLSLKKNYRFRLKTTANENTIVFSLVNNLILGEGDLQLLNIKILSYICGVPLLIGSISIIISLYLILDFFLKQNQVFNKKLKFFFIFLFILPLASFILVIYNYIYIWLFFTLFSLIIIFCLFFKFIIPKIIKTNSEFNSNEKIDPKYVNIINFWENIYLNIETKYYIPKKWFFFWKSNVSNINSKYYISVDLLVLIPITIYSWVHTKKLFIAEFLALRGIYIFFLYKTFFLLFLYFLPCLLIFMLFAVPQVKNYFLLKYKVNVFFELGWENILFDVSINCVKNGIIVVFFFSAGLVGYFGWEILNDMTDLSFLQVDQANSRSCQHLEELIEIKKIIKKIGKNINSIDWSLFEVSVVKTAPLDKYTLYRFFF
jgi:hypothetical protein